MIPTERPVPPAARNRRSSTSTRPRPSPVRWKASEAPVTPPPMTTTSAVRVMPACCGRSLRDLRAPSLVDREPRVGPRRVRSSVPTPHVRGPLGRDDLDDTDLLELLLIVAKPAEDRQV